MKNDFMDTLPKHEFLVCVDSDGCAIDTMDIKHIKCFGPCMVKEWNLEKWEKPILERWNKINLYSLTRGINRFKGLAMALKEIDEQYCKIDGINKFVLWVDNSTTLSNDTVLDAYNNTGCEIFSKALHWSNAVNKAINALPTELKKVFLGVKNALSVAKEVADVVVVSSANKDAVLDEWERYNLLDNVDYLMCQDLGTKAKCIARLKQKGYTSDHILMCGDALGDMKAAKENGVLFYPILVSHEAESWAEFPNALSHFINRDYDVYGAKKANEFLNNLS